MEGRLLLDVVVGESAAILKLLAGENQALLVRRDTLLVLDLALDIVDGVRGLDLEGDGLARKGLDEAVICQSRIEGFEISLLGGGEILGELTSALLEKRH